MMLSAVFPQTYRLDLGAIAEEIGLIPEDKLSWSDNDVPLHKRGVSCSWLIKFVHRVDDAWQAVVKRHERDTLASYRYDGPSPDPLPFHPGLEVTPEFLVEYVIKPMTQALAAPLFARVPDQYKGEPDVFISHPWKNHLASANAFATLYAVDSPLRSYDAREFIWIDIACYNQHRVECVAGDMKAVIASIRRLGFPVGNIEPFKRLWCIWELLCAHVVDARIEVYEPHNSPYNLGLLADRFCEEFKSVERADISKLDDRDQILEAMISTFGSIPEADEYVRHLANSMLSKQSHKPWNNPRIQ